VSDRLLLLGHFQCAQVLLQLTLLNTVFVLRVFQSDLSFFLQLSQLVKVLENKMLQLLFVDLDGDLVLLFQVLVLSFLVSELGLLVFELLLGYKPEVVDSQTLVIVESCEVILLLDLSDERANFDSQRLLVALIRDIVNSVGTLGCLLISCQVLRSGWLLILWFRSHISNYGSYKLFNYKFNLIS